MEPVSFFSGIQSGIDFRQLVDAIIAEKQRPADLMRSRIAGIESRSAAYAGLRDRVADLRDAAGALSDGTAFGGRTVSVSGFLPGAGSGLVATASEDAPAGTYSVRVLQKAAAEQLAGTDFQASGTALGLSGEFFVGDARVDVAATDSLADIASAIQSATASTGSPVAATILSRGPDAHRLVLTSKQVGAAGIDLVDGSSGLLRSLGLLDTSTSVKHLTSNGALSDGFAASDVGLSTEIGLTNIPPISTVTIGLGPAAFTVDIDLGSDTLDQIAANINAAAAGAGSSVTATVVQETTGPQAGYRLDIDGTTAFQDAGGVLEILGLLEGGRGAVAHQVQGNVLEGPGGNPAGAGTRFSQLQVGGSSLGVQNGDTLTISGRRGDGSIFSLTYTVGSNDTLQDLVDRVNSNVDGLQAGARTATASISADGRLTVTDDLSGESQLSLSVVANNEGGGTLDFGTIADTQIGRSRQVQAGRDAIVEVNGALFQRSTNSITDAVTGVTLDLVKADPATTLTVDVDQNLGGAEDAIVALAEAYNTIVDYIEEQSAPVSEGQNTRPFSGNVTVRGIRDRLRRAIQGSLLPGAAGNLTRLGDIGIEIDRNGRFTVDRAKLGNSFDADPVSVSRLFSSFGESSATAVRFLNGSDATTAGTYSVDVTQQATRATITGTGFAGTYVDDGVADTLTVTDVASGSVYEVALADGMTLQQITNALNTEFGTAKAHELATGQVLDSDALGTAATAGTTLDQIHIGGSSAGVANGDTITISGTRAGGVAFSFDYAVADASTQTLGDLMATIDAQFGADASVSLVNGLLTATANQTGTSQIGLTLTSDNAGGGTLAFGTFTDTVVGRSTAGLSASDASGQLKLEHGEYGSGQGFDLQVVAGGSSGAASLGVAAGTVTGQDVQGTIGGIAATGQGRILTGTTGSAVDGLAVEVVGGSLGTIADVTYSRGIAALVETLAADMTDGEADSIDALADRGDETIRRLTARIERFEALLANRKEALLKRFVSLEEAFARSQSQSSFLLSTIGGVSIGDNKSS